MYGNFPGILKKWQLIFYGTATNPIRIRNRPYNLVKMLANFRIIPEIFNIYLCDERLEKSSLTLEFQGYQGLYAGAASSLESSMATFDGNSGSLMTNRLPEPDTSPLDITRRIQFHDCDSQCNIQGCYGKGPTQCVSCKNYRLDKLVFKSVLIIFKTCINVLIIYNTLCDHL